MLNKIRLLLILALSTSIACHAQHTVVYFISPPRSLSVTFLRMIDARGDFTIFHEPSQYAFNLINSPDKVQSWFTADAPVTYNEVKKQILNAAQQSNVFVKEISFAVQDWIGQDQDMLQNSSVYFVFLMRNPHHATLSFYKKVHSVFDEVQYQFNDLIGYKSLYEIYNAIKKSAVNAPYLMLTEDLYNNPEQTIQKFCTAVGIPYIKEALAWEDLGASFDGHDKWHEIKYKESTYHWHNDAIRSTGFGKPATYAVDQNGNPTFEEITNLEHRRQCIEAYKANLSFYQKLLHEARA